jgi:hypothetical protein
MKGYGIKLKNRRVMAFKKDDEYLIVFKNRVSKKNIRETKIRITDEAYQAIIRLYFELNKEQSEGEEN